MFKACTEPDELAKWWGPRGFIAPSVEVDFGVGGSYRIAMQPPDDAVFYVSGELFVFDPAANVCYTFQWEDPDPDDQETVVTLSLRSLGESTELLLLNVPLPPRDGVRFTNKVGQRASSGFRN
ncbi:MAG: SRPBCC domain-containing protein [Solirubrobacterales bacterium]|nr:SRPBCC domain-containing protein [Solirubrobacterales bacterium]